jgi:hypothetical protein
MKWVTRANVKVDRVACPWLIRTFIDRDAEFLFVPVGEVESVARKTGAIPYDVAGVELGHHGEECSFDAIVKKYNVKDAAISRLALIVPARSHTAVTRPRGDRGRIQAARRRAGLRRSRNNSPRAASLRCALSLLRGRPQQAAAGLNAL